MTHEIDPPRAYAAGESLIQTFNITEDNSAKDITGATIDWYLLPAQGADDSNAIHDDSESGIDASITDAANGTVKVSIDQDITTDLGGERLYQRLVVDDNGPGKQIWGGIFSIDRP